MKPTNCPCLSKNAFKNCCEPYLTNTKSPLHADSLMRSRYTAYTLKNIEYLVKTQVKDDNPNLFTEITAFASQAKFIHLDLISHQILDQTHEKVEFKARYIMDDQVYLMHETSNFIKQDNQWRYVNGDVQFSQKKLSRNENCPCLSGKKYKRCCAV